EEALVEAARVVARGDAAVAGAEAAAERVRRRVEPAGGEVEADRRRRGLAEDPLPFDRVLALQDRARGLAPRGQDRPDERDQLVAQGGERAADLGRRRPRLVLVEQGVVARRGVADSVGLAALQLDELLQPRP